MKLSDLLMVIGVGVLLVSAIRAGEAKPTFRPVPEGVVELTGFSADGGIVELNDGSLMLAQGYSYRISQDGGQTWGDAQPLNAEIGAAGIIRLQSGALAIYGKKGDGWYFSSSPDEGKTWTAPVLITDYPVHPMYHSMIQLKSGRLLLAGYLQLNAQAPDAWRHTRSNYGLWKGKVIWMEGHRGVEFLASLVYYSDDEGQSWQQCNGVLFGWFDERGVPNGGAGITTAGEPTCAETKDGRVLLFARSKVGRLVQSYSLDGGVTWQSIVPSELASTQAPPLLIQIPQTGDLLCVWNQVSGEEIRRGFHRSRLSAAISKDSGLTWQNFKTLELQEGLADVARITPEFPIVQRLVGRPGLGKLPDGYAVFDYANVDIIGDKVFIRYSRAWPEMREVETEEVEKTGGWPTNPPLYENQEAAWTGEGVMRIYPLEWFYQE